MPNTNRIIFFDPNSLSPDNSAHDVNGGKFEVNLYKIVDLTDSE